MFSYHVVLYGVTKVMASRRLADDFEYFLFLLTVWAIRLRSGSRDVLLCYFFFSTPCRTDVRTTKPDFHQILSCQTWIRQILVVLTRPRWLCLDARLNSVVCQSILVVPGETRWAISEKQYRVTIAFSPASPRVHTPLDTFPRERSVLTLSSECRFSSRFDLDLMLRCCACSA